MTDVAVKERNSNIELFRICCMFGITLAHMVLHTKALESTDMYVRIWAQFFNIFSKAGVNGFVMITAWHSCCKPFKISLLKRNVTWIVLFALIFLSTVVFTVLERYVPIVREGTNFFTGMHILPLVLASLSIFLCFENTNVSYSEIINWGGRHTFPVYLIQSNTFFTVLLWKAMSELNLGATKLFPLYVVLFTTLINIVFMLVSVGVE